MDVDRDPELSDGDKAFQRAWSAAYDFGEECSRFRKTCERDGGAPLEIIMNALMTELWDRCFSQSEIRAAFESALADMNRYAAGDELRP